ncbi:unnamed protein product [Ilex paraguariensis]|uniref:GH18 domain-containing protein n=1 Tax=Ilex paraguariensis TaxID=185542 RepID=A0ABC8SXM5_9AQUA
MALINSSNTAVSYSPHPPRIKETVWILAVMRLMPLIPSAVSSIKSKHSNVKVALSLGGNTAGGVEVLFHPSSIDSWVSNAVSSLTHIIKQYNLDGIDIDYEHFGATPEIFAECIGQVITILKKNRVISFASIAPFDDDQVQAHYLVLWKSYGRLIDYVNFQYYAYDQGTTVAQFISFFKTQSRNYNGGKVLVSFTSEENGGLSPENGFFTACNMLKKQQQLHGIFVWSADDSKGRRIPLREAISNTVSNIQVGL